MSNTIEYVADFGRGYKKRLRKTTYEDGSILIDDIEIVEWNGVPFVPANT